MYHELDRSEGPVLGIELTETVTESDLRSLERRIDAVVAEHGRVRLLVRCDSLPPPSSPSSRTTSRSGARTATPSSASPSSRRAASWSGRRS